MCPRCNTFLKHSGQGALTKNTLDKMVSEIWSIFKSRKYWAEAPKDCTIEFYALVPHLQASLIGGRYMCHRLYELWVYLHVSVNERSLFGNKQVYMVNVEFGKVPANKPIMMVYLYIDTRMRFF